MLTNNLVIFAFLCVLFLELVSAGTNRTLPFSLRGVDLYLITGHYLISNLNSRAISISSKCACINLLSTLPHSIAVSTFFLKRLNTTRCRIANSNVELHQLRFLKYSDTQNYVTITKDQFVTPFKFDTKGGFIYYEVQENITRYDYDTISSACAVAGGRLPIIKTLMELEGYVEQRVALQNTDMYHGWMIGLSRNTSADPWMWDDGTLFLDTEVSLKYSIGETYKINQANICIQLPDILFYDNVPMKFWAFCQIDIFGK